MIIEDMRESHDADYKKMPRKTIVLPCLAILLLCSAIFVGQDFQLRTKVDLVVVPTSVRDANGSLIPNLKQDDFTVLEDGNPQTISNFSTDPQPLSAVILIDTAMGGGELRRLNLVAGTLFSQFREVDEVAAYRYDHFVTKLSDFTNNPQLLAKSFDNVRQIAESKPQDDEVGRGMEPSALRWILDRTQIGSNGAPPNPTTPTTTPGPAPSNRPAPVSTVLHDAVFSAVVDLEKRPNNHRKIVILISDGQVAGSEHSQTEVSTRLLRDAIQVYAVGTDLKLFEHMTVLNSYARSTGGTVFDGGKEESMAASFGQLVEQARDQYVLGYVSNNELTGTRPVVRKIEVKVREPKVKVTHRTAYLQYPS
jgi:VWFA-related protein